MSARIITITREFGSGGRTVGKMVADALGFDFYDWNLVEKTAQESGFAREFVEENAEDASNPMPWLFRMQSAGSDLSDQLYLAQRRVIMELAEKGNCVIVGRCADYILQERTDVMSCFIFADEAFKKERVVSVYGENGTAIEKRLKEKDRKRKAHYQYYTGRKWGRAYYYDLCVDSGRIGIPTTADLIIAVALAFDSTKAREEK